MPNIYPGHKKDLIQHIRLTATQVTDPGPSTTVYVIARLEDPDGGVLDGLYWDHSVTGWRSYGGVGTWPSCTHRGNGLWSYELPASAGLKIGQKIHCIWTEDVSTPASETAYGLPKTYECVGLPHQDSVDATIHTEDSSGAAIPYVKVTVVSSGGSTVYLTGTTDEEGDLAISLPAGSYEARAMRPGYAFDVHQTITVAAAATMDVVGDAVSGADSPDGCLVYGTIKSGVVPLANATVRMTQVTRPGKPEVENSILMANVPQTTTTNANGYFELEMAAGTTVYVEIPECGIRHEIDLDDVSTYDLSDEFD